MYLMPHGLLLECHLTYLTKEQMLLLIVCKVIFSKKSTKKDKNNPFIIFLC